MIVARTPDHRYITEAGEEYLATTKVFGQLGWLNYTDDLARQRGTWVHQMTEAYDRGQMPAATGHPWYGFVLAYLKFVTEAKPDICDIELIGWVDAWKVGGTVDRTLFLNDRWSVIDLKTGVPEPWHPLQTASYARMCVYEDRLPDRYALYLSGDGSYQLRVHANPYDERIFEACLTVARFMESHHVARADSQPSLDVA